jgi:hypothetical protein
MFNGINKQYGAVSRRMGFGGACWSAGDLKLKGGHIF